MATEYSHDNDMELFCASWFLINDGDRDNAMCVTEHLEAGQIESENIPRI